MLAAPPAAALPQHFRPRFELRHAATAATGCLIAQPAAARLRAVAARAILLACPSRWQLGRRNMGNPLELRRGTPACIMSGVFSAVWGRPGSDFGGEPACPDVGVCTTTFHRLTFGRQALAVGKRRTAVGGVVHGCLRVRRGGKGATGGERRPRKEKKSEAVELQARFFAAPTLAVSVSRYRSRAHKSRAALPRPLWPARRCFLRSACSKHFATCACLGS